MAERVEEIYQALLDLGLSEQEINHQIHEKLTEYQGFMTKQAVLFLIAKENGINIYSTEYNPEVQNEIEELIDYKDFAIPISEVSEGMQNIVITGIITKIFESKNFTRKDGTLGIVGSFQICDNSQCIKIVLWGEQVKIMENTCFQNGEVIQIIGGYSKKGITENLEVHLSRKGKIVLSPKNINLTKIEKKDPEKRSKKNIKKKHSKISIQGFHEKEGFIRYISGTVQIDEFKELTLKSGEKSFLLKLILSDELSSIKVNIWGIKAVEYVKIINDGDYVKLRNLLIKENHYSNEKEFNFTRSSNLEII